MNPNYLKVSDYVAASMPVTASAGAKILAGLTLAEWSSIASIASTLFGAALGALYLLWKWRREAKKDDSNHPFPPTE